MLGRAYILAVIMAAALGQVARADEPRPEPGSKARQLLLKQALDQKINGSLVADLSENKRTWQNLKPEQVQRLRQQVYAFLRESDDRQAALLLASEQFANLSPDQRRAFNDRADWLSKVLAGLTDQQRAELRAMTPGARAKRLMELKAQLSASQPASRPTSQPTTAPAR